MSVDLSQPTPLPVGDNLLKKEHFTSSDDHHVGEASPTSKPNLNTSHSFQSLQQRPHDSQQHPLHQVDMTAMKRFYESCISKLEEQNPSWKSAEWLRPRAGQKPQPIAENPQVFSEKQRVLEAFARFVRESGEPMILLPNFDYGDVMNFERFLQCMKQDGINAIRKYKSYLANKDMRKYEVDLVVMHAKYGIMLLECKECDHLDGRRRSKARMQLTSARNCFESLSRLMLEAKGGATATEGPLPITEFIALPNMLERPQYNQQQQPKQGLNTSLNTSTSSRMHRMVNFLIRPDMESSASFAQWWSQFVAEKFTQRQQQLEAAKKPASFDPNLLNMLSGLVSCVRHNSILPVVYQENEGDCVLPPTTTDETNKVDELQQMEPALKVYAEMFHAEHEQARTLPKCVVLSRDAEKLRKSICLQTLWLLLNDAQKKISVVCSELNKPYYEEFFSQQRKMHSNLNNVRFYTDLNACVVNPGQAASHSKKDNEMWIFDSQLNGPLKDVLERAKELSAFWVFTGEYEQVEQQYRQELDALNVKRVNLDSSSSEVSETKPWASGLGCGRSLKMPMRLQCDLLVIGDLVSVSQLKMFYRHLSSQSVANQTTHYQLDRNGHYPTGGNNQQQQQYQLHFNPSKKLKSVKFIRGGTIDNLRTALQMHDSIRAPVVLMHVGDEDVFKTRNSTTTVDRIKEMTSLVREYCPDSFVVLSTLMRRMSKSENTVTNDVNKGIVQFCKQTRDTTNVHFMLNNNLDPDYHTYEGRSLSHKGFRVFVENLLFVVDYFLIRKNKQN